MSVRFEKQDSSIINWYGIRGLNKGDNIENILPKCKKNERIISQWK